MSVTAVIVNYHTTPLIRPILDDLAHVSILDEIIIVDNSGDYTSVHHSGEMIPKVVSPEENIGYGQGINLGVAAVASKWVLVVNPDMRIPSGAVERLVEGAEIAGAVLAGPRFYWDDEKQFRLPPALGASAWMDYAQMCQTRSRFEADHFAFYWQIRHDRFWNETAPFVEPFLSGACMLIDRKWAVEAHEKYGKTPAVDGKGRVNSSHVRLSEATKNARTRTADPEGFHINPHGSRPTTGNESSDMSLAYNSFQIKAPDAIFDPRFFMYYEDTDLAVSATLDGNPPICVPSSEMIHYYNQSPDPGVTKSQMMEKSHALFKKKHYGTLGFEAPGDVIHPPECVLVEDMNRNFIFEVPDEKKKVLDDFHTSPLYFEIGVTPFFIPFGQRLLTGRSDEDPVTIPDLFWERLSPGEYYARLRTPLKGVLQRWKWKKQ